MKAVLYICHGSRSAEGQKEAVAFVERLSSSISIPIQHICFLELCEPNIVTGVERCVREGAKMIYAIPLLLLSANHAKHDIPLELEKAKEMFPSVTITYGKPFGVQHDIVSAISDTIQQADAIMLVGRGSSDTEAQADFQQIAYLLQNETNIPVYPCYLAAASPSFSDVVARLHIQVVINKLRLYHTFYFSGSCLTTFIRRCKHNKQARCHLRCILPFEHTTFWIVSLKNN